MKQHHLLLLVIFISHFVAGQKNKYRIPDSLQNKSYTYLDDRAYELKKDSSKAAVYLLSYLQKAKNEQNWKEAVNAYQNLLHQSPDKQKLIYADSMIYAAKKTNDNAIIGSAYLSQGIAYYSLKDHSEAMDNYIIANSYISKTKEKYIIFKLKYHMALVKYYLGYYEEAISLLKECETFFKNKNPQPYLNSLHSLGLCYNRTGNYGLCDETNILGLEQCKKLGIPEMEVYFIHSQGINAYFKKNYDFAIQNIESTIEQLNENNDFGNESVGYFYIGKSYWELKKYEKAILYFKKVDHLFTTKGYLRPDLREAYELLINYYQNKNDSKSESYYVKQLLKADKMLDETYAYLARRINKEYNTKELLRLQAQLAKKSYNYSVLIGFTSLLFSGLLIVTYRNFRNRKLYKQLMLQSNQSKAKTKLKAKNEKQAIPGINHDTVTMILRQLEKFEKEKKYLYKDWKIGKLATLFKTNPTYLSAIIHHYKDKRFNDYINDLKIDYIVSLLQTDKKTQKFTNKALAEEAGFSTTELFAKAFKAKTKISTAYFIEQIKKENT